MHGDKTGESNNGLPNLTFNQELTSGDDDSQRQQMMLQQAIHASLQSFLSPAFVQNPMGTQGMIPSVPVGMPQQDQFNPQQIHHPQNHQRETQQPDYGTSQFNSQNSIQHNPHPRPPSQISFSGYPMMQTNFPVLSTSSSVTSTQDTSRKRKATESLPVQHKDVSADDNVPRTMDKEEFDRLSPAAKRRYDRNLREQQRSHQISQKIKQLRDVLSEAKVSFKPNKFSILVSVSDYIQQLQSQAIMLDADYQRLRETLRQTQEALVTGDNVSRSVRGPDSTSTAVISCGDVEGRSSSSSSNDEHKDLYFSYNCSSPTSNLNGDGSFAQSIDYEQIFLHCPYPWALASLDGRVLSCNPKFAETVGVTNHGDLVQQSLFLFIQNHQEIFEAMGDLLKRSKFTEENGEAAIQNPQLLFWCGSIVSTQEQRLDMSITLAPLADGNPGYFNLSVSVVG